MIEKLDYLNQTELHRQETFSKAIEQYINELRSTIRNNAETYHKQLSKTNENLLIKLDDILCVDEVTKHGK